MFKLKGTKVLRKIQSSNLVYRRLIISHVIVVAALSIAISSAAAVFFSKTLEGQVIDSDREMLSRISESANGRIFGMTEKIWTTSVQQENSLGRFFSEPSSVDNSYFYSIYEQINRIKGENYDLIDDIEVYSKELGILISSKHGIKYIRGAHTDTSFSKFSKMIEDGYIRSEWIALPPDEKENAWESDFKIALFRTYPYIKNVGMPFKGYCAIVLKENAVYNMISLDKNTNDEQIMIINSAGVVCSSSNRDLVGTALGEEEYISRILSSEEKNIFFLYNGKVGKQMVSASQIGDTGLRVIKIVSSKIFFKDITLMRLIIVLICFIFIIIGILVSIFLVRNTYQPLKNIISNIKGMVTQDNNTPVNEYNLINSTIDTLSIKVSELEDTLKDNEQIIKNSLIIDLLNGDAGDSEKISQRFKIANIIMNQPNYTVIAIAVAQKPDAEISKMEYCKFDVMSKLNERSDEKCRYYAASMPQGRIGVIVNAKKTNVKRILMDLYNISEFASEKHDTGLYYGVGTWSESPDNLVISWRNAEKCLGYHYINPEQDLFLSDELSARETSETALSKNILTGFDESLKYGEYEDACEQINAVIKEIRASNCTKIQCDFCLNNMINIILKHMLEQNIDSSQIYPKSLYVGLKNYDDIYSATDWVKGIVEKYFVLKKNQTVISNLQIIEGVKKYIDENISSDISLATVADKLFFSAPYLSKIFKRETGVNFNSYVTEKRLEYARDLLMTSNYSVNVISEKAGFHSSNYFIKKFKERYGDTPMNYKNIYINSDLKGKEK